MIRHRPEEGMLNRDMRRLLERMNRDDMAYRDEVSEYVTLK